MSVDTMIAQAEKDLGLKGRPNYVTNEYADRNGGEYRSAPWCDEGITYAARHSGNFDAVCLGQDFAYTVAHAERFRQAGRWHVDVDGIQRGDIVFFDWDGSNNIANIDHVEVVTGVSGSYVYTIGYNTSDSCARRVRTADTIVGYGRPAYTTPGPAYPGYYLRRTTPMQHNGDVLTLQRLLNAQGADLDEDSWLGDDTEAAIVAYQQAHGLKDDGVAGPLTWASLTH